MTSTFTRQLARFAAGALIAAGLAVGGSLGMADIAVADTNSSTGSDSNRQNSTTKRETQAQTGLNGNLPQRPITNRLDQFSHLPFNPAVPGGD